MKKKNFVIALLSITLCITCTSENKKQSEATNNQISKVQANTLPHNDDNDSLDNDNLDNHNIDTTISYFKDLNIEKIADNINYPLLREYPIPSIKNKQELRKRFHEVFDNKLIQMIAQSKISDWEEYGWRGYSINNGEVWMADSHGIITAVNYQSNFEAHLIKELIIKDKAQLHPSLRNYMKPIAKYKTKNHHIRIDQISDDNFRYASWSIGESESAKPSIVLNNGILKLEGTMNVEYYIFKNGIYTYTLAQNLADGNFDMTLEITKNDNIIQSEEAYEIN